MSVESGKVQDEFFESLLGDFLDESSQLLHRLNEDLLVLDEWAAELDEGEKARCDDDLMNNMFRSVHSIKGLSAMLGLSNLNGLTHKIENIFDAARKDEITLHSDTVEVVFQSIDALSAMLDQLREEGNDEFASEEVSAKIQSILQDAGCERKQKTQAEAEKALQEELAKNQESKTIVDKNTVAQTEAVPLEDFFTEITDETSIPPKYLAIFIDETEMTLDTMSDNLLGNDSQDEQEVVKSLMITSHRIKGSAASIGLNRPAKLSHFMEDILQELRDNGGSLWPELIDVLLKCTDSLRNYNTALKEGRYETEGFNQLAHELLAVQKNSTGGSKQPAETSAAKAHPTAPASETSQKSATESVVSGFDEQLLQEIKDRSLTESSLVVGRVRFQEALPLVGLKSQLVYEKLSQLGKLTYTDPNVEGVDLLEQIPCLVFAIATSQPEEAIQSAVNISGVVNIELTLIPGTSKQAVSSDSTVAAKIESKESQQTKKPAGKIESPQASEKKPVAAKGKPAKNSNVSKPNATLRVDIDRLDQLMNLAGQLVISKARFSQIGDSLKSSMLSKQVPQLIANAASMADKILSDAESLEKKNSRSVKAEVESICSHSRRLQSDLESVTREIEHLSQIRSSLHQLFEAVHQLDRVTDGIQKSIMDTRMVPIGPLFSRFKRVIRDITRGNEKDIRLVIRGENTELDKRMVDELGDPLIHMIRNSADHGIELPAQRIAAGKPAQGTVTLDAFHRGNSIVIQIKDDGKGLDREKILAKAIEKGLVTAADAETMSPQQIYQLIWEPGLSTAEKVTDISGRGMGMDIVRSKIEEINGTVEVDSKPGEGSVFKIKLPLTLAILPSLMAKIDGDIFAMPVESIVEIVSVDKSDLKSVHGKTTARIRGRVVSVVYLPEIFTWGQGTKNRVSPGMEECTLVIIGDEGCEIGLAVDDLLGEEDIVIKSLAENYQNVAGIAGASILGDGRVSLILDPNALIEMASKSVYAGTH